MNLSLFNRDWYLSNNPDIAAAVAAGLIDPEQHFVQFGMAEGRSPHPLFDADFYLQANPDVAEAVQNGAISAAEHFFMFGMNEPRAINPVIHLGEYLASNPDVAQAAQNGQIDALTHLLNYGVREGRELGNGISAQLFTQDTVFATALEQGNPGAALQRVAEVAPFLPTFRAPEGWTPPAETPVPLDFMPPAGVQLVIPASVKVPENVTLPPQFSAPVVNPPGPPAQPTPPGNAGSPGNSAPPSNNNDGNNTPDVQTPPTPAATQIFTPKPGTTAGSSDASTAIALDANYMVVGDDEANVLRVYDRKGGDALVEWSFESSTKGAFGNDELDLEAGTRIGNTLYFIGSHSNKKSGAEADSREFLFSVTVDGTGAATTFTMGSVRDGLEALLVNWDNDNAHNKGANYFGFGASSVSGVIPEAVNGFSIEGMTVSLDGSELLLGFRAPQTDAGTRDKAVIIPLKLADLFGTTPTIGTPIELDLGGRGIRAIEKAADGSGYLILAGPAMSASAEVTHDFRLFTWDGSAAPQELDVSLDTLRDATGGSFETLVEVPSILPGTRIQLLQDNGDTVWEGQTSVSKDLSPAHQKFMGNWITLDNPVASNDAPELLRTSPATGSDKAFKAANIELIFDRGVQRGTEGTITLKAEGQADRIINIDDTTQVTFNFNTVVINPAADLLTGTAYTVEISAGAIRGWNGLTGESALQFSTATPPDNYSLLISEVNSNASGGDFFELYNHGATDIDLSGWKWTDSAATFSSAEGIFPAGTIIAAGKSLVVSASESLTSFLNAWSLPQITHPVVATGGAGLGKGDAVVVFNADGFTAAAFNYGSSPLTASDGTVIAALPGGGDKHAGEIVAGGGTKVSAVWDGVSTTTPNYVTVDATLAGSVTQSDGSKGTPGVVFANQALPRYDLLITEVNSNGTGGDFVELYNHGTTSIDLSGWKFTDSEGASKANSIATLANGTTLGAGETLVLLVKNEAANFKSAWGLPADASNVIYAGTNAPGLGSMDGVVILDAAGKTAAAFNYGSAAFKAPDGTLIAPVPGGTGHAGQAVGGEATTSAIWDGVSTVNPTYVAASAALGSHVQTNGTVGSPGVAKPVVPPVSYDLLITEVNSQPGTGDEFFELYNHGSSAIDLSGWTWTDAAGVTTAAFGNGTVIGAGEVLLVINGADTSGFLNTWGLSAETTKFINFTTGPGLGKGDAVVVLDTLNNTAVSFNYRAEFTSINGRVIPSSVNTVPAENSHAGTAVGGTDTVSAIWDGVSTVNPSYIAATTGELGAITLTGNPATIGSPGSLGLVA